MRATNSVMPTMSTPKGVAHSLPSCVERPSVSSSVRARFSSATTCMYRTPVSRQVMNVVEPTCTTWLCHDLHTSDLSVSFWLCYAAGEHCQARVRTRVLCGHARWASTHFSLLLGAQADELSLLLPQKPPRACRTCNARVFV